MCPLCCDQSTNKKSISPTRDSELQTTSKLVHALIYSTSPSHLYQVLLLGSTRIYPMSRDDHYGFVQSESLASMQCSSVPDVRAVMHYSRPTPLCAHAYITLSKLHAINVILTSYCGQYQTEYPPSRLHHSGRYSPILPAVFGQYYIHT